MSIRMRIPNHVLYKIITWNLAITQINLNAMKCCKKWNYCTTILIVMLWHQITCNAYCTYLNVQSVIYVNAFEWNSKKLYKINVGIRFYLIDVTVRSLRTFSPRLVTLVWFLLSHIFEDYILGLTIAYGELGSVPPGSLVL